MRILFISCDPGGTNCLIPVYLQLMDKYACVFVSKGSSVRICNARGIPCKMLDASNTIEEDRNQIRNIIQEEEPYIILTGTSSDDLIERLAWEEAKRNCIRTIAILDAWVNYIVRFSKYKLKSHHTFSNKDVCVLPDYIAVPDMLAKKDLQKIGIDEEKIVVCGQPYLEYIKKKFEDIDLEEIRSYTERRGIHEKRIILYASDNLSQYTKNGVSPWGFDERSTYDILEKNILKLCPYYDDYIIMIRPHPKEDSEYWEKRVCEADLPITTIIDTSSRSEISIMASDLIVGSFTMLLNEGLIAGKKVISMQINSKKKESFYAAEIGLVSPCYSIADLCYELEKYFNGTFYNRKLHIGNNAINNICKIVENELEKMT